jgi:hypothetical protein
MDAIPEPRPRRRAAARPGLTELAERVARLETTAEHLQETLSRIDTGLAAMRVKLDALGGTMNQAMGGLRVGAVVWQLLAGALGFLAAHFWPVGK